MYFRDDGVSSTNVNIAFTTTGWFEDVTGEETVAANSLCNCFLDNAGTMMGNNIAIQELLLSYRHAATDVSIMNGGNSGANSTTFYFLLQSGTGETSEANAQVAIQRNQTAINLRTVLSSGTSTDGTVALRIGGSTSANLSIAYTGLGAFEDLVGSDSLTADQLVNFSVAPTSGTIAPILIQVDLQSAESFWGRSFGSGQTFTTRNYYGFIVATLSTSINTNYTAHMGSTNAGNLQTYISVAGSGTRDVALVVNTTISTNLAINVTSTGRLQDQTGSESIADTDAVQATAASTGSAITIMNVLVELPWSAVAPPGALVGALTAGRMLRGGLLQRGVLVGK